jgi:predicted CxxxxCH...CXXCH cytochrome family protein
VHRRARLVRLGRPFAVVISCLAFVLFSHLPPSSSAAQTPDEGPVCRGTGAHDAYAAQGISCAECHPCGAKVEGGHDVAWMDSASSGFHAIAANRGLGTCQPCHGAQLDGAATAVTLACDDCHGANWRTECTMCHGDPAVPGGAPPRATWGNGLDPVRTGAHRAHLVAQHRLSTPVACEACHVVPATPFAAGHTDGGKAGVTFDALASIGPVPPAWNREAATCSNVYCHGASLDAGGTGTLPVWTTTDGTFATCGTCHASPPPAPHLANPDCGACHTDYTATTVHVPSHVNGFVDVGALTCSSCHGTDENPAPPIGTNGETETTFLAVGAHDTHVRGGLVAAPIACAECHPSAANAGHANAVVEMTFGPIAAARGALPVWDREAATCSASYCHGAFPGGETQNAPLWTVVDGSQGGCGSCHGIAPPPPHVQNDRCGDCHTGYSASSVALATHVNGRVDAAGLTCTSCHGSAANPAPPLSTAGETSTTARSVGAHQAHLSPAGLAKALTCASCHVNPAKPIHADTVVSIVWSPLAKTGGLSPQWNGATCSSTYCHGATLSGGTHPNPVWTQVDGTQAACGSCHGAPPPAPHVGNTDCSKCHVGYTATTVNQATHVNGKLDVVALSCSSCHGSRANVAPPLGTRGETDTTSRAVGAHQAHYDPHGIGGRLTCDECHPIAATMDHADGTVQLAWGSWATANGAAPVWNPASGTCSNVYCHGGTLEAGGDHVQPVWTIVDGSQERCGSCHGAPPPPPHVPNPDCGRCHDGYTATTTNAQQHIDTDVDVTPMTCTSCHGDPARTIAPPAPPTGSGGETATTARAVGAHQAHLAGGTLGTPVACETCHVVPTVMTHADGTPQVKLAGWNPATATCSATYCHGTFTGGNATNAPSWTTVDGSQAQCGTCHGRPPASPHPQKEACDVCHPGYTSTTVNQATHADGHVDVKPMSCDACHGADGVPAPPVGTKGELATTARAVGAHRQHLAGGAIGRPVACETCHDVPLAMSHFDGAVQVKLAIGWTAADATCANTCHGAALAGGTVARPQWTKVDGTQAACGACHGLPPPPPHTSNPACANCHDGYAPGAVNLTTHLDGDVDVKPMTCTSCHGEEGRAIAPVAPPLGTGGETETTQRGVGAHQRHLAGGALGAPVACEECHVVPAAMDHFDGTVDLGFGPRSRHMGAQPAYDTATGTCSGVYCHGAVLRGGGSNLDPSWTGGAAETTCGSCHGKPPPPPHVQTAICDNCHSGYTQTSVDPVKHLNGVVESDDLTCSDCHGDDSRVLVSQADVLAIAAPPYGSRGETENTSRSVGQHQAHVNRGNGLAIPNKCRYCHPVPAATELAHANAVNDVVFSSLAKVGGAAPVWDAATGTCASTYCHGATLNRGGTSHTPSWLGSNPIVCGTCHGAPPPLPHPQDADCIRCHPGYTQTSVRKATHVNGISDFPSGCNSCHDNPPNSGEHYEHIQEGVKCSSCHAGYTRTIENPTLHRNAKQDVTRSGWNATTRTCSSANGCHGSEYWGRTSSGAAQSCNRCHGVPPRSGEHEEHEEYACSRCHGTGYSRTTVSAATHMNGSVTVVVGGWSPTYLRCSSANGCHESEDWGQRGSVTPNCANCHGFPPGLPHPQKTACQDCHPSMNATGTLTEKHNDGYLDISGAGCASCHGNPPTQTRRGGLHPTDTNCYGCHSTTVNAANEVVPSGTHNDGGVNVGGGGVGTYGCQACHGDKERAGIPGSDPNVKSAPPLGTRGETDPALSPVGAHQAHVNDAASLAAPIACAECHVVPATMDHAYGTTIVTFGALSRTGGASPTWDGTTCTSTYCHGGTLGAGGTNQVPSWAGGASQATCGSCHAAPPPAPHTDSGFCQGCHIGYTATSVNRATHVNGVVDAGTSCGDCHGLPPPAPHSTSTACGSCHQGYTQASVNPVTHGNGTVDVSNPHPTGYAAATVHGYEATRTGYAQCFGCHGAALTGGASGGSCDRCHQGWATSCTFCHGNAATGRQSPPVDTQGRTARTTVSVGAHDKHVATTRMMAIACNACHPARGDAVVDPAHVVDLGPTEVAFANQSGTLGTWTRTSDTAGSCASTYCHGNFTNGKNATVSWVSTTVMTCSSCHKPNTGSGSTYNSGEHEKHVRSERIACSTCHGTGYSSTTVNSTLHVNRTKNLQTTVRWNPTSRTCSSNNCHGSESWY